MSKPFPTIEEISSKPHLWTLAALIDELDELIESRAIIKCGSHSQTLSKDDLERVEYHTRVITAIKKYIKENFSETRLCR